MLTRANKTTHGNPDNDVLKNHREAYYNFVEEKKRAKSRLHERLCNEINLNPWGQAYRQAITALKPKTKAKTPKNIDSIILTLFPKHTPFDFPRASCSKDKDDFTVEEIQTAAKKLKGNKSPGPDGIPAEVIKIIANERPEVFLKTMNKLLETGHFPDIWKTATLKLLPKEGNTELTPKYRPICLINTLAKLLEHMLNERLLEELERTNGISPRQHAFTKKKSCITALDTVVKFMEMTRRRGSQWVPAMILLDVKNAFNSANWAKILNALRHLKIKEYIIDMVASYFRDRKLSIDGKDYYLTSGVPQGSVLGPTLWNVLINPITKIELPDYCDMVLYADDIAILIAAKDGPSMTHRGNLALKRVETELLRLGLDLASDKSTSLIVNGKRTSIPTNTRFSLGGHDLINKTSVKYLGVYLDKDLNFQQHSEKTCQKATRALNALSAILRSKNARMARRRVIARVVEAQLLYGCEVWRGRMTAKALNDMEAVQKRAAVKIAQGFPSMSGEAALVLTGMIPLDIQAQGRQSKFQRIRETETETRRRWQDRWNKTGPTWTKSLIPQIDRWIDRPHGELSASITEIMSGHGHFGTFLKMTGKTNSSVCNVCQTQESVRHVLMYCPRFDQERTTAGLQAECDPTRITKYMLTSRENWNRVEALLCAITKAGKLHLSR